MCEANDISTCWKTNNGSSREIWMVINFHLDVHFRLIIYRDSRNCRQKLSENWNSHHFWLGCMCEAHDISRRSKMNYGSSREIQMVRTFPSDLRFWRITYRDCQNWRCKLSAYSNGHYFWLGCMCQAHDISRRSKMKTEALEKFKWS